MADDDAKSGLSATRRSLLGWIGGSLALGISNKAMTMAPAITRLRPARDRLEAALARIADPAGEGARTCLTLYAETARAAADAADARARAGTSLGPLDGRIVSIKDLFDVAGEPTRAGSLILADAAPATADAPVVQRLRGAGAVIVAKTNMVEFAFSGMGLNPHYGTPRNPADRARAPGGSTSGGGVAVADGFCEIAIGTDTGGSTRIPAALCGITGYKPSKARIPTEGAFPLSPSLDSIGPMARNVADCAAADAVLAGDKPWMLEPADLEGLRFVIPRGLPMLDLDATVSRRFAAATEQLKRAGATLIERDFPQFDGMARVNAPVPLASVEAWHIHRKWLETKGPDYDPFVRARIALGASVSDETYAAMLADRKRLVADMDAAMADLDVMVLPTTPIVAPTIAELTGEAMVAKNRLLLRNTSIANFFDLCAVSLPQKGEGLPTGLMLVARNGADRRLFGVAAGVEKLLSI